MLTGTDDHASAAKCYFGAQELVALCLGGPPFGAAANGIAVVNTGVGLTYHDLAVRVAAGAAALVRHGVRPGRFVGVPVIRSVETVVAILASWAAGAGYCPIDTAVNPAAHIAALLDAIVVTTGAPVVRCGEVPAVYLAAETETAHAEDFLEAGGRRVLDSYPAYLMPTSGSSGAPKEAVVTRGGLRAVFQAFRGALASQLPDGARWTQLHPLTFGYSVFELLGSLVFGGQLVLVRREEPLTLEHLMAEIQGGAGPHVVCLTPSELAVLVDRVRRSGGKLPSHIVLSGEAAHKAPLAEVFTLAGDDPPVIVNTYAATETSGQITAHVVTPASLPAVADGYVGAPLPGVDVVLRRPDSRSIAHSDTTTVGQIHVSGPTLAAGYLDPAQTRRRFVTPPDRSGIEYATGDLGQWSMSAGLRVVGRADRMTKLGGQWVGMEQIERLVTESDLVAEVAAFAGQLGDQGPDCLCLTVVPDIGQRPAPVQLRNDVVRRLPLKVTVRLTATDRLPRLASGKVDIGRLAEELAAKPLCTNHTGDVARTVRTEWTSMLGVGVATDKNLFELGVDSLGTVAAAARLSKALDFSVSPEFLLNNPRIELQMARLTALIGHRGSKATENEELNRAALHMRSSEPTEKGK
jgi:acyl-CoA synthetase (AMP-forming)/AMP-acid ligase II/acyl carrier protein